MYYHCWSTWNRTPCISNLEQNKENSCQDIIIHSFRYKNQTCNSTFMSRINKILKRFHAFHILSFSYRYGIAYLQKKKKKTPPPRYHNSNFLFQTFASTATSFGRGIFKLFIIPFGEYNKLILMFSVWFPLWNAYGDEMKKYGLLYSILQYSILT